MFSDTLLIRMVIGDLAELHGLTYDKTLDPFSVQDMRISIRRGNRFVHVFTEGNYRVIGGREYVYIDGLVEA